MLEAVVKQVAFMALCTGLSVLSASVGWAQENGTGDMDDFGASPAQAKGQLWCTVPDGASKRMFVSNTAPLEGVGHIALWNAGDRFLAVVNARDTLTLRGGDHACHEFADRSHVLKARDAAQTAARQREERVVVVGAY